MPPIFIADRGAGSLCFPRNVLDSRSSTPDCVSSVKHQIGFFLQLVVLSALPALILYQLYFGIPLIVMPACLLAGVILFAAGTHLREN